jgi:hypothetical protein
MKRKDALKIVKDILLEVTYDELATPRAERILKSLEKVGMTPPEYRELGPCGCCEDTHSGWETETDE